MTGRKPLLIAPPTEPSYSSPSPRLFKPFKGVRHWWIRQSNNENNQQPLNFTKEGIAMTLTAVINIQQDTQPATTLHSSTTLFTPNAAYDTQRTTSNTYLPPAHTYNARAFVHYDPTRSFLALGADSISNQTQVLWLSLERYSWLISQLHEEQYVDTFLKNCYSKANSTLSAQQYRHSTSAPPSCGSSLSTPSLGLYPFIFTTSPILAVHNARYTSSTALTRRLTRFVHLGNSKHYHPMNDIYLFMIPKALLLQAAAYIPMTKPLPPMFTTTDYQQEKKETTKIATTASPFTDLLPNDSKRFTRYIHLLTMTAHDLIAIPIYQIKNDSKHDSTFSPEAQHTTTNLEQQHENNQGQFELFCSRCGHTPGFETLTYTTSGFSVSVDANQLLEPTFTIVYFQPIVNNSSESTHLYHETRPHSQSPTTNSTTKQRDISPLFNTFPKRQQQTTTNGTQHGSIERLSCTDSTSTSGATTGSFSIPFQKSNTDDINLYTFERKGFIAIDHEHQEILVIFPDLPLAKSGGTIDLDTSFFIPVPWYEEEDDNKDEINTQSQSLDQKGQLLSSLEEEQRKKKTNRRRTLLRKKNTTSDIEPSLSPSPPPVSPLPPVSSTPSSESSSSSSIPFVLNGALTSWRRCELDVATLLMRTCKSTPQHYHVVMIGHGLGAAVASLCALSLVSTGLLSNRKVSYCGVHPPRIGNTGLEELLSRQNIDTTRIMHPNDIMAHLPPRTSGLVHIGNTTIIDNKKWMIRGQNAHDMEDRIDRILPTVKTFDTDYHGSALDINLYPSSCTSTSLLTIP
ncbi:uncharacterized protein BX664DRAFT_326137 [Halteromyces radiatus]|uniref:uncharacterized protein n=1 Tax=Halteromyces radiatus TaxID=101107 RepID=UPI00221FC26F|nr:uncharacterized protein BX664DRAFT_326137 [Halteromyces radiatus]KAI8097329.1 hypothetical protein BX664DRAFT_326137 [Halteromyces radiatus]